MSTTELDISFIDKLKTISIEGVQDFNFFELGGAGYLENPTSDLLALFMGGSKVVPPWLLKALLCCLDSTINVDDIDFTSLNVIREAQTVDGKFLDLLVRHDEFVIGIEHKVYADTYNPFPSYVNLINSLDNNNQKIFKCILKPDCNATKEVDGWRVINYSEFLSMACQRLGNELLNEAFNKWTVFYQEFLNHLHKLSEINMGKVKNKNIEFVTDNFSSLIKAAQLLEEYQSAVTEEAKLVVSGVLPDVNIRVSINNWDGYYKAIHLMPACWGEGKTGVTLFYRPASDGSDKAEFYVNAWIHSNDFPGIHALLDIVQNKLSSGNFLSTASSEDYDVSIKSKGQLLELSFWGLTRKKACALNLLNDMTKWVDKNVRS